MCINCVSICIKHMYEFVFKMPKVCIQAERTPYPPPLSPAPMQNQAELTKIGKLSLPKLQKFAN